MFRLLVVTGLVWLNMTIGAQHGTAADAPSPEIVSVRKIWDRAPHNAFTDLTRFQDRWYCVFREGKGHVSPDGALRVITSVDGETWASAAVITSATSDLRDAKITVTGDGRLMLSGAEAVTEGSTRRHQSLVWFSPDGTDWSARYEVADPDFWLWRTTWHNDRAYGFGYGTRKDNQIVRLYSSGDGRRFETLVENAAPGTGYANETSMVFLPDDTCYCLLRRDEKAGSGLLGIARSPYTDWTWKDLGVRIGGPHMLRLPDGRLIAAVRLYDKKVRTALCWIDPEAGTLTECLTFPSGGDTSYPGLVWHEGLLWVSYYSSHEGKTSIYLAKVRIPGVVTPLAIGSRRELFVDRYLIDRLDGTRLEMHAPQPREIVLKPDRPWEGIYSGYYTVLRDEKRFRMYYRGMPEARHTLDTEVTCYAESNDGVHWTKPKLGLFEVGGSRDNNVILARHRACHNFAPMLDANPNAPDSERYKALGGTGKPGLIALASSDGIHWREIQKEPVITQGAFDSQNVAFWSEAEECYVCYFRVFRDKTRWISRCTSDDFRKWSEPVEMGMDGKPRQHLYTNQTTPYLLAPHIYLGLPTRFMPGRRALGEATLRKIGTPQEWNYGNDCADIMLTSTRGGADFKRTFMEAFIRPGLDPRNWTSRANYAAHGIVRTGPEELSLFVSHNCGYPTSHVRRYTLRPDGFASVTAPYEGGELLTKPLTFTGNRLMINYATSAAGGIHVEIQDVSGRPIEGYALADSVEIIGDELERAVTWKGGDNVGRLAGQAVRLRFVMKDADLFAVQFTGKR